MSNNNIYGDWTSASKELPPLQADGEYSVPCFVTLQNKDNKKRVARGRTFGGPNSFTGSNDWTNLSEHGHNEQIRKEEIVISWIVIPPLPPVFEGNKEHMVSNPSLVSMGADICQVHQIVDGKYVVKRTTFTAVRESETRENTDPAFGSLTPLKSAKRAV